MGRQNVFDVSSVKKSAHGVKRDFEKKKKKATITIYNNLKKNINLYVRSPLFIPHIIWQKPDIVYRYHIIC